MKKIKIISPNEGLQILARHKEEHPGSGHPDDHPKFCFANNVEDFKKDLEELPFIGIRFFSSNPFTTLLNGPLGTINHYQYMADVYEVPSPPQDVIDSIKKLFGSGYICQGLSGAVYFNKNRPPSDPFFESVLLWGVKNYTENPKDSLIKID